LFLNVILIWSLIYLEIKLYLGQFLLEKKMLILKLFSQVLINGHVMSFIWTGSIVMHRYVQIYQGKFQSVGHIFQ